MKTKKDYTYLIMSLTFVIVASLGLLFYPKLTAADTIKTSQTITTASYSSIDKVYYIYTSKDSQGRLWVVSFKPNIGETLDQFKKRVTGHTIDIYYIVDKSADGDAEIVKTVIH
jgi:hypothetical protein